MSFGKEPNWIYLRIKYWKLNGAIVAESFWVKLQTDDNSNNPLKKLRAKKGELEEKKLMNFEQNIW